MANQLARLDLEYNAQKHANWLSYKNKNEPTLIYELENPTKIETKESQGREKASLLLLRKKDLKRDINMCGSQERCKYVEKRDKREKIKMV
jgi:ferredoxin-NADP reductase